MNKPVALESATAAVRYRPALADALGHPKRLRILLWNAQGGESASGIATGLKIPPPEVDYHLVQVLTRQLRFVKEEGGRPGTGSASDPCFVIDWARLNQTILWTGLAAPEFSRGAGAAFQGVIDECIGCLESGSLRLGREAVLEWYESRMGSMEGRLLQGLLKHAEICLQLARDPSAGRPALQDGVKGAVLVVSLGTCMTRAELP